LSLFPPLPTGRQAAGVLVLLSADPTDL
jgi:hypothetical protein